jgi:hypothetical protein
MRVSVIQQIIAGIESLEADPAALQKFRALVCNVAAQHGCKSLERGERVAYALKLHNASVSRTTIAERLQARYCISRRQSYRDVQAALQLCHNSTPIGTKA